MLLRRTARTGSDSKIQWLADLPWWGDLSHQDLVHLAATADRTLVPAGRQLMEQGELGLEAVVGVGRPVGRRRALTAVRRPAEAARVRP